MQAAGEKDMFNSGECKLKQHFFVVKQILLDLIFYITYSLISANIVQVKCKKHGAITDKINYLSWQSYYFHLGSPVIDEADDIGRVSNMNSLNILRMEISVATS